MTVSKKAMAMGLCLTLGLSGTALAAEQTPAAKNANNDAVAASSAAGADSFSDVPQGHWAYDALDFLAKDGIIEGMGDGTFQGGRTMTRYEMASIVAKAMQKSNLGIGDEAVLEKLRNEYSNEIDILKKQTEQNTKDIQDLKNGIAGKLEMNGFIRVQYDYDKYNPSQGSDYHNQDNDRFYLNLYGKYKVNDNWKACYQLEKNSFYNNGHDHENESGVYAAGGVGQYARSRAKRWSGHDGDIQRIWVEGLNPHNDAWINIGRSWRGLGQQNVLFGTESDGFQFGVPIPSTNLTGSGFWFSSTGAGTRESWYGLGTWGKIGHSVGINVAYAQNTKDKGDVYEARTGHVDPWGENTVNYDKAYVLSGWLDLAKNVRFLTDYVKTNADYQNNSMFYRLNYRDTDLTKPGSYQIYGRYYRYGANGTIAGDDEWSSLYYNGSAGSKGWVLGFKYVPWRNIEWETLYSKQHQIANSDNKRTLMRTQMDFHF